MCRTEIPEKDSLIEKIDEFLEKNADIIYRECHLGEGIYDLFIKHLADNRPCTKSIE